MLVYDAGQYGETPKPIWRAADRKLSS